MTKGSEMELEDCGQPAQLLQAWRNRNIDEFQRILRENCDPKHIYHDEKYLPILGIISRDAEPGDLEAKKFAEAVCETKVNLDEQYVNGMCAMHFVCERGNWSILETLVKEGADVNAKEGTASTPLHILIKNWKGDSHKKCMEFLLRQQNINFNAINNAGFVPIHLAAQRRNEVALRILLEKGSLLQLDDTHVGYDKVSPRQAILAAFPHLANELPPNLGPDWTFIKMDSSKLFNLLYQEEEERFCTAFEKEMQDKSQKSLLTATNGKETLLQLACTKGLANAVQTILSSGADVNFTTQGEEPIRIVTRKGNPELLQKLLDHHPRLCSDQLNHTVLHTLVIHFKNEENYLSCLKILLGLVDQRIIDINCQDIFGCTALYYAALNFPNVLVHHLLDHGAYLAVKNNKDETPLKWIPPKVLEDYLDSMVSESGKSFGSENYTINFNYKFLEPRSTKIFNPKDEEIPLTSETKVGNRRIMDETMLETSPLLVMVDTPGMRNLLTHPLLTSFTFLKWQRIDLLFYLNLSFYVMFSLLFSGYVILGYRSAPTHNETESHNGNGTNPSLSGTLSQPVTKILGLRLLILIFILFLFLRELFQMATDYKRYWCRLENWIELFLIALSVSVVVKDCPRSLSGTMGYICPQLCAVSILLVWIELLFLIGKHPILSIQMEMLRTVSVSFVKYLSLYVILIIGFALSFFALFRGSSGQCDNENPFDGAGVSFFKTMVMLTGELEAGDIPFMSFVGTSHLIFAAFVLLIAIILLNLLNGLAVADTKAIRDDAYLCTCVARVKLLAFIENVLQGDALSFLKQLTICSCCPFQCSYRCVLLKYFAEKIKCFPELIRGSIVSVRPNLSRFVEFPQDKDSLDGEPERDMVYTKQTRKQSKYFMDDDTINAARVILERKRSIEPDIGKEAETNEPYFLKVDSLTSKLDELEMKFDAIEQSNKQIEQLLIQITAIISLNQANNEDR